MSLTIEQSDEEILSYFNNMQEGQEYVLNQFCFTEMNRLCKENNWSLIQNREEYKFVRRGQKLFINSREFFDFTGKSNLTLSFTFALGHASGFAFTLTFSFALQHNGLEKLKSDTCDGKVVEIDGKKYKLTAV